MVNYNNISLKIWINVFNFIEHPIHLLECRLVCKRWDYPAETAMLSKDLKVSCSKSIIKLQNHLTKHPSRAHFVRFLDVCSFYQEYDDLQLELIKVAFNPNLEYWKTGMVDQVNGMVIYTVLEIIRGLPENTVYQLREMPFSDINDDANYAKLAYIMRNTLTSLKISATSGPMNTYLQKLTVFKSLTKLSLDAEALESIAQLDSILKNCPYLDSLKLASPMNNYVAQDRDTLANWMINYVDKFNGLTCLKIDSVQPDFIEYLVYKYPKIKTLDFGYTHQYRFRHNQAFRVFLALANIPNFRMSYIFDQHQELLNSIPIIFGLREQSADINAGISYGSDEWLRLSFSDFVDFNVILPNNLSTRAHAEVLDQIYALNDKFKLLRLNISMLSLQPVPNDEGLTIYEIMTKFPAITELNYEWKQIRFEPMETKTNLDKLEIRYAEIDDTVLPQISEICPELRRLDLVGCSIIDNESHPDKVYNINLPKTSLCDLYVRASPEIDDFRTKHLYIDFMETQNTVTGDCYLKLFILEGDVRFYYRFNSTEEPEIISRSQFEARPRKPEDATFFVTCALILNLNFHITGMEFAINMKKDLLKRFMNDSEKVRLQMERLTLGVVKNPAKLYEPAVDHFGKQGIDLTLLAQKLYAFEKRESEYYKSVLIP